MANEPRAEVAPVASVRPGVRGALLLVALGAALLRCWLLAADLPDFLEEAAPFRTALEMWTRAGGADAWNPHSLVYPSLTIYLHLLLLKLGGWLAGLGGAACSPADAWVLAALDPTSLVLPARGLHVLCGAATVFLAGVIAERLRPGAGVPAALLATFSPTLLATSRLIYTDTVMTVLALAALERMLAWHERGGGARLAAAVVLIGLAAGAKYPGAVALVPLVWLLVHRRGARGTLLALPSVLGATAVFLLTTPYALLDPAQLRWDLAQHGLHVAGGHLGQAAAAALPFVLERLWLDLGPMGVALLIPAIALPATRRGARADIVAVWLFLLAFLVPVAAARYALGHYLVPVIPTAAVLTAVTALELARRAPRRWSRPLAALLLAALVAPVAFHGLGEAIAKADVPQVRAHHWLEQHVGSRDVVLMETWGPRLPSLVERLTTLDDPRFAAASPELRRRYLARRWFYAIELPLKVGGRVAGGVTAADGRRHEVDVFPSALDANCVTYDPRLFALADFVVTSSAVRGRFEQEPARYADICHVYHLLDGTATVVARFVPPSPAAGPSLVVYRIGRGARTALAASGPLEPTWWTEKIPDEYRRAVTALGDTPWEADALQPDGTASPWVRSLAHVYQDHLLTFADRLALTLVDLGRCDAAQPLVEGTLLVLPDDPVAVSLYERCTGTRARWVRRGP